MFEMRYNFKQLGIFEDFICYQKLTRKNFKDGLMVIDCDLAALKSIKYFDYNQNVEYYIEHIAPGTWLKEMSDYCKLDIPSKVQNMLEGHENKSQKTSSSTVLLMENTIVLDVVSTGGKTPNLVSNAPEKHEHGKEADEQENESDRAAGDNI